MHKFDISDRVWALIAPRLPGQPGQWGGVAEDNRKFINAVFWILRTGAPWRDLPPSYGNWNSVARRFRRWAKEGVWEKVLETLIDEPDYEWLIVGEKHIRHSPPATETGDSSQVAEFMEEGAAPRYTWPWMRMVCQSEQLLQQVPMQISRKLSR